MLRFFKPCRRASILPADVELLQQLCNRLFDRGGLLLGFRFFRHYRRDMS
jgi:hypothetical protein